MQRIAILCLALVVLAACEETPGAWITGVVQADSELTMPLSRAKACVGRLVLTRGTGSDHGSSSTSTSSDKHLWAERPTLTVDGEKLELLGTSGDPKYTRTGDRWDWKRSHPKKAPASLRGWGYDSTFKSLNSESGHLGTRYLSVEEEYVPCGTELRVRAIRWGDRLELVDPGKVEGRNMLKAFGVVVGAFLCCGIVPLLLVIGSVVGRWKKKWREETR